MIESKGKRFIQAQEELSWPEAQNAGQQATLILKDDDLFLITNSLGNITSGSQGLFCRDTRFLSRLELQIAGQSPIVLSSDAQRGYAFSVWLTNPYLHPEDSDPIWPHTLGIQRELFLQGGVVEEILLTNYGLHPISFQISLTFDADFVDLFEIRGFTRSKRGSLLTVSSETADPDKIILAYQGLDKAILESYVEFDHYRPTLIQKKTAIWELQLGSQQSVQLGYRITLFTDGKPASQVPVALTLLQAKAAELVEQAAWWQQICRIRSDNTTVNQLIEQAERDIYLLRQSFLERKILAAGIPWYCTLFGRDSLISAAQTLILDPSLARDTLYLLAAYQGQKQDSWREEAPGKILHELRLGEMARCQEIPHTPYYGSVDATPLWISLYTQYYQWTADEETREDLWPHALAAMNWIDEEMTANGYLTYSGLSTGGLTHQGWKDSSHGIVDRHGHVPKGPIALAEVQGYVYQAKQAMGSLARHLGQSDLADRWHQEAEELQTRFNRDFWIRDLNYCAVALDGSGNPVDSITSNPGHCLSSGILFVDKAQQVAQRLQEPDILTGWGIRTLSSLSPAYNPMGYHTGSIWPHDNGLILQGFRKLNNLRPLLDLSQGLIEMILQYPDLRPPELICGYDRTEDNIPVRYPVACAPQAWATGTLFQLLTLWINLLPDIPQQTLTLAQPTLPRFLKRLSLENLRLGSHRFDLEFIREGSVTTCWVLKNPSQLKIVIQE
jgi:glycogen debranching enzyme